MKIKNLLLLVGFFILNYNMSFSQNVLNHEREIDSPDLYDFFEINFDNPEEEFLLSGTLIAPKNGFQKVIVIVPGTGKDGRNSHFKLAENLLQHNIAVFRYDERGVGKSEGRYFDLYLFSPIREFNDLYFCVSSLRHNEILSGKQIGVIGHSEGGIASIEAYNKGAEIDFLVQMATPIKPFEIVSHQHKTSPDLAFFESLKMSQAQRGEFIELVNDIVQRNKGLSNAKIRKVLDKEAKKGGFKKHQYKSYVSNTLFLNMLRKDYMSYYQKIDIPVYYIIGSNDELVSPDKNIKLINKINNRLIDVEVVEDLFHMLSKKTFREANVEMYQMDEIAIKLILDWIKDI